MTPPAAPARRPAWERLPLLVLGFVALFAGLGAGLARLGWPIDLLILDHTFGYKGRSSGHMNSEQFVEHVARLRGMGLLAPAARVFATHIGHHSNPAHPDLAQYAAARGYEVAYDGLSVEV